MTRIRFDASAQTNDYYTATAPQAETFPALAAAASCDLCVVGGGYTGLSAALHGAELGLDVVVLEAATLGAGASGRNGGQVGSGQRRDILELEEMVGGERALELWQIGENAKALALELIEQHRIDCDPAPGILYPDHKAAYGTYSRKLAAAMSERFGIEGWHYLNADQMKSQVNARGYHGGLLDITAWHLHPLKFLRGLARAAKNAGARIHEYSRVTDWHRDGDGYRAETPKGAIKCRKLIFACNGYQGALRIGNFGPRLMPINNFIAATRPLTEQEIAALIPNRYAVADSRFVINYCRIDAQSRLIFGGGENYSYKFPTDIAAFVRKPLAHVFPQLSEIEISHAWGGTLAITRNRMPVFAEIQPGAIALGGFSGHGISIGTLAGRLAVDKLGSGSSAFDAMAQLGAPAFPGGGALRSPLLALGMLAARFRDRWL